MLKVNCISRGIWTNHKVKVCKPQTIKTNPVQSKMQTQLFPWRSYKYKSNFQQKKSNHFLTSFHLILNFSSFRYAQKLIQDFWENFIKQDISIATEEVENVKFAAYKQINQFKHRLTFTFFWYTRSFFFDLTWNYFSLNVTLFLLRKHIF